MTLSKSYLYEFIEVKEPVFLSDYLRSCQPEYFGCQAHIENLEIALVGRK